MGNWVSNGQGKPCLMAVQLCTLSRPCDLALLFRIIWIWTGEGFGEESVRP